MGAERHDFVLAVGGKRRVGAPGAQRFDHAVPGHRRGDLIEGLAGRVPLRVAVEHRRERGGQGVGVAGRHCAAQSACPHEIAEVIPLGAHDRQPRPEVVEHPGAEGIARFEVRVVGADPEIGFHEVERALLVGHPVVEDDVRPRDAERLGQRP